MLIKMMGRWGRSLAIIIFLIFISQPALVSVNLRNNGNVFGISYMRDGKTLYVGGDGPNNYSSIQDAINDAEDGDTIIVFGGTYEETLRINKGLSIFGKKNKEGQPPILVPKSSDFPERMIYITSENCIFSGFIINGLNKSYRGIWVKGDENIISNNKIINNDIGISLHYCSQNIIEHNILSNNSFYSIDLHEASGNIIRWNKFFNNFWGIVTSSSPNNIFSNNTFFRDGINTWSAQTIENNTVDGKPIRYYFKKENFVIPHDTGEVILIECKNVTVSNVIFSNVSIGICAAHSSRIVVENNAFFKTTAGIRMVASQDIQIKHNLFRSTNLSSIQIWSASNVIIKYNKISNSRRSAINSFSHDSKILHNIISNVGDYGIWIDGVNNVISYNLISHCKDGILLGYGESENCTISYNIIYSNSRYGVSIAGDYAFRQKSNIVEGNLIYNNTLAGICVSLSKTTLIRYNVLQKNGKGVYIYDAYGVEVTHNNFIHNYIDANFKIYSRGFSSNSWSRNFWSGWYKPFKKPIYGTIDNNETIAYDVMPRHFPFILPYFLSLLGAIKTLVKVSY